MLNASVYEKSLWVQRWATKGKHGLEEGVWRSSQGKFIAPLALLYSLIKDVHAIDQCARGEVIRTIQKVRWSPYLSQMVDNELSKCTVCASFNNRKSISAPIGHFPVPDGPFRHLQIEYVDMIQRVGKCRYILVVVDRFSRWVEAIPASSPDAATVVTFLCEDQTRDRRP